MRSRSAESRIVSCVGAAGSPRLLTAGNGASSAALAAQIPGVVEGAGEAEVIDNLMAEPVWMFERIKGAIWGRTSEETGLPGAKR